MKTKKIMYLDSCMPDYFQGFSGTTLIAFYYPKITIKDVLDSLLLNANNESHDQEIYQALHNYISEIKENYIESDPFSPSLDKLYKADLDNEDNEDNEFPVIYFGVTENEE